jgi:hypothetical protein|tara:strand:- start:1889 stop:2800 length:912 start_codon:yes stop_codon:yes gene_type:complete
MATGLSLSSTSNLTNGQRIIIASAKEAFEPAAPDPDLIESERIPTGSKQWDISTYARLTDASALTEGVDLSSVQQLATNTLQLTPAEHGILVTLSNRLIRRQGDSSVVTVAGRQIGSSLRRRMAKDVIALYDGFSKSIVNTGNAMDITHFRGAAAYLLTDNNASFGPAPMPLQAALHIEQISDIVADLSHGMPQSVTRTADSGASFNGLSADLVQRWWRGSDRLYGIPIFHSGNIERDSSNDAKGAIFASEALYMVVANDSDVTEEDDNSLRAREYGIFQEWAEGERADPHGVEVYSNATATV